ncbi:MAG: DNRLRE domain-containing protein [Betaproteobacteria bacterium]
MIRSRWKTSAKSVMMGWAAAAALACTQPAAAAIQMLTLGASADTTIYGDPTFRANGNGSGEGLFAGNNGNGFARRAMLDFDLTGIDPAATIVGATLSLYADRAPNGKPQDVSLYRLTADWGEGASNAAATPGQGTAAQPGDATWYYRHFADDARRWTGDGGNGDFVATPTATQTVTTELAWYTWSASDQSAANALMLADLQMWVDHPETNFGWMLKGNEAATQTVKRFGSRELVGYAPQLTLTFDLPVAAIPEPRTWILFAAGLAAIALLRGLPERRRA